MKSILDPSFHYTPSASTDLRKTFARVRRELKRATSNSQHPACKRCGNKNCQCERVVPIQARAKK